MNYIVKFKVTETLFTVSFYVINVKLYWVFVSSILRWTPPPPSPTPPPGPEIENWSPPPPPRPYWEIKSILLAHVDVVCVLPLWDAKVIKQIGAYILILDSLSHQVPTGLLRPRIIGHFQQFFKYSKYGPIAFIFLFKVPISIHFHPPKRMQVHCKGRGRQLIANTTR
jgi:hypothetical protein